MEQEEERDELGPWCEFSALREDICAHCMGHVAFWDFASQRERNKYIYE